MRRSAIGLVLSLLLPGLAAAASPLLLDCSAEQSLPGRALVCEYSMLGRQNDQLADLQEQLILAGRAGSGNLKVWVSSRDACRDVECLDRLYEAGMRDARLALVDVEAREPAVILTNARGESLRVAPARPAPQAPQVVQESVARERSAPETAASLLMIVFLVAVFGYTVLARRLAA